MKAPRNGSVGAITVHPSQKFFAVAEMMESDPYIYVYKYPSLQICRILKGGAERGYADLCFNAKGTKIASIACDPDYMLTVWSWKDSAILLRSKAFSQDVYRISFSQDNDGILTSSGMGHIKFWRMSNTFTGLKLQGYIGKFGASELTDIASFIQLPDGKVLSSTETGNFLLWDGGMIKCEIGVKGKRPCHQGRIEVILLGEGEVITGGEDGYFRVWDLETIDNADVQSTNEGTGSSAAVPRVFEMEPIDEILVSKDVKIKNIVRFPSTSDYLIQDQQGQLLKLDLNKRVTERLMSFHSGSVVGLAFSPLNHQMATLGVGGNLRIYDYLQKQMVNRNLFPQGGSCLHYLPLVLDSSGSAFVAGFSDGVIRIVSALPSGFMLHYVFKPHKKAVTSVHFSPEGSKMLTASEDGTIFLFHLNIRKQNESFIPFSKNTVGITPIGFIALEAPALHVSFAQDYEQMQLPKRKPVDAAKCYLSLSNGSMYTAKIPLENEYDTTSTYELNSSIFKLQKWSIQVPEKIIPLAEQPAQGSETGSQTNLAKEAPQTLLDSKAMLSLSLNSLRKVKGLTLKSDAPISAALGLREDFMILAVTNSENEYEIRLVNTKNPTKSELICVLNEPISVMQFDQTKQCILAGSTKGGCSIIRFNLDRYFKYAPVRSEEHQTYAQYVESLEVRTQKTIEEVELENPGITSNPNFDLIVDGQSWTGHLHDISQGRITSMCSTFDFAFLATSGADGGIFLWRNSSCNIENANVFDVELQDHLSSIVQPDDIVESTAYSIQEAKLKSEKDRELEAAEAKKQIVRNQLQELRNEFNQLMIENENAPVHLQLDRTEIKVDPYLREDIEKDAKEKKENLLRELQWNAARDAIGAEKLKRKFLDPLKSERIQLHAFKSGSKVETFRTLNLDSFTEPLLAQLLNSTEKTANSDSSLAASYLRKEDPSLAGADGENHFKKSQRKENAISKLDARKQQRAERAAQWKALMDSKPDEKYEDPQDVAAIRHAIANMGDYKLKTADNYIVPENERVDADKKKRQLILLNDSIKTLKENFNSKVFALRDCKVRIIERFHESKSEINKINAELLDLSEQVSPPPEPPKLESGLFPEDREKVCQEDIEEFQRAELEQSQSKRGKDDGLGFGSGSEPAPKEKESLQETHKAESDSMPASKPTTASKPTSPKDLGTKPIDIEKIELQAKKALLKYRKACLIEALEDEILRFDQTIDRLSKDRMLLAADLKYADIKLQLLFKEWVLLKEFEQTDNVLAEKLNTKKSEKKELESKIAEYREKLLSKKVEIDAIIRQERNIQEEYRNLVGENNKNEEFLTKVFKRKIKRVKKKVAEEGENEENESEEEDEVSDESSYNSEDEEGDEFQEVIPGDCDQATWNAILELREKRLDVEEVLQEVQKNVEV
jgi:WD40 repeat protein